MKSQNTQFVIEQYQKMDVQPWLLRKSARLLRQLVWLHGQFKVNTVTQSPKVAKVTSIMKWQRHVATSTTTITKNDFNCTTSEIQS